MLVETLNTYQVSPRVTLRVGDLFRLQGGPEYRDERGDPHVLRLPGVFSLRGVIRRGRRVWLECVGVDGRGVSGSRTVFVQGKSYRRFGLLHRPFRVLRVTAKRWSRGKGGR